MPKGKPKTKAKGAHPSDKKGPRYQREVDTNVISITLASLKDQTALATGDPVLCGKCKAVFNMHSRVDPAAVGVAGMQRGVWRCEFCNEANAVTIEPEEMPKADELTYVLESAHQAMKKDADQVGSVEDVSIIFCLDVSGSMCVTQMVEGQQALKYAKTKQLKSLMKFSDGSQQLLKGEKRNATYVSRMQCLQAAVEKQLVDLAQGAPARKVGLVTFSNDVTLIGDGQLPPKVITGDKLNNFELLQQAGTNDAAAYVSKGIKDTKDSLVKRLETIEESGQTALGPALVVALGLAAKGKPGSKVILCTDGLANVGLGSVEDLGTEAAFTGARDFYARIGEQAKSQGVSISLISIVGEECHLEMLSPLADLTAGDILKVDPTHLAEDFAQILSEAVIATNVELRVKLHKGLTFRNEDARNLSEDQTLLIRHVGNATESQEVTFEYCMKSNSELERMPDVDFSKLSKLPFQTQISYRTLSGMRCLRLITKTQDVTNTKDEAKKVANYAVLSVNAVQQTAKLSQNGRYREAQANMFHWKKMIRGSEDYHAFVANSRPFYNILQEEHVAAGRAANLESARAEGGAMRAKKRVTADRMISYSNQGAKFNKKSLSKK